MNGYCSAKTSQFVVADILEVNSRQYCLLAASFFIDLKKKEKTDCVFNVLVELAQFLNNELANRALLNRNLVLLFFIYSAGVRFNPPWGLELQTFKNGAKNRYEWLSCGKKAQILNIAEERQACYWY